MGKKPNKNSCKGKCQEKNSCKEEGKEKKIHAEGKSNCDFFRKSEFQKSTILLGTNIYEQKSLSSY